MKKSILIFFLVGLAPLFPYQPFEAVFLGTDSRSLVFDDGGNSVLRIESKDQLAILTDGAMGIRLKVDVQGRDGYGKAASLFAKNCREEGVVGYACFAKDWRSWEPDVLLGKEFPQVVYLESGSWCFYDGDSGVQAVPRYSSLSASLKLLGSKIYCSAASLVSRIFSLLKRLF